MQQIAGLWAVRQKKAAGSIGGPHNDGVKAAAEKTERRALNARGDASVKAVTARVLGAVSHKNIS